MKTTDKAAVIARIQQNQPATFEDLIHSPYLLEFLGLEEKPAYTENDHINNTRPRPDLARKAVLLSALYQFFDESVKLIRRKSGRGPGGFTCR